MGREGSLLHLANPYVDFGEGVRDGTEVGVGVVIRDEDLGVEGLGGGDALGRGHGKGLVDGEEGEVDVGEA